MKLNRTTFGLVLFLFFFFFIPSQADENPGVSTKNTLWKISSQSHTVYILGSIHFLKRDNYPLNSTIEKAFDQSHVLVMEIDLDSQSDPETQQMMLMKGMLPTGQTLETVLSQKTYDLAKTKISEMGLDMTMFSQLKPWLFAMTIIISKLQTMGYNPQLGIDTYFASKANESGKKIIGLETLEFQISLFDNLNVKQQDMLVLQTIKDLDIAETQMETIISAWASGNTSKMEDVLLESFKEYPDIYDIFLTRRNRNWLKKIEAFLKDDRNYMVVVGAGHLVGKGGLIDMLKEKGYSVDQL